MKQQRSILYSRSVLLLKCLRVIKQGIGLYNEYHRSLSFCMLNLLLTNELASSSLCQKAHPETLQPPFPVLVFPVKLPQL